MGNLFVIAGILLCALWISYPNGLSKTFPVKSSGGEVADEAYCGMTKHILLLLFTFGVWFLIWIYRVTGYTNAAKNEEKRNPTTKLLLCIFVPFYIIFWVYKTAQRIDKIAKEKCVASELSTLCLILAIFVPIIPPILMQDKLNAVVTSEPVKATSASTPYAADELKKYKELLDMGAITEEEFNAKKKQFLNL